MLLRSQTSLFLLKPPYAGVEGVDPGRSLRNESRDIPQGSILLWNMAREEASESTFHVVSRRPYGLPLVVFLPPAGAWKRSARKAFELVVETRPIRMLPHQRVPAIGEVVQAVREGPGAISAEVLDYLFWRGIWMDRGTRQVVGKIGDLSSEVATLGSVARALYMSRRSLGRCFQTQGLPAPSLWLKMFRILRASILLQRTGLSLQDVARSLRYPDAFTLSNQMHLLMGVRPERVRDQIGWEWVLEAWIQNQIARGSFRIMSAKQPAQGMEIQQ